MCRCFSKNYRCLKIFEKKKYKLQCLWEESVTEPIRDFKPYSAKKKIQWWRQRQLKGGDFDDSDWFPLVPAGSSH